MPEKPEEKELKEEVDEIIDRTIEPKQKFHAKPLPTSNYAQPTIQERREEFNSRPESKETGTIAVSKSIHLFWQILAVFLILIILGMGLWFNISYSGKSFSNNFTIENNNQINPSIPVNIINNISMEYYGNYTLYLPKELSDALIKALNNTNSS